jgi:acetate kinase
MEHTGMEELELARVLEHESGLLGLAGSADMREVLAGATTGEVSAQLALDVYVHRLGAGIAAMAAALGGIDALAFTGGVGERSPDIRARAVRRLAFLGLTIDDKLNAEVAGDREITASGSSRPVLVLHAREDLEIAWQARAVLSRPPG